MRQYLAPKDKWINLRRSLNNSYSINDNWKEAIAIFENRIKSFYLNPIDKLVNLKTLKGEGFSIVTLQCALIEMFSAFRQGKIYNIKKPKKGGLKYEYKDSPECFVNFLHTDEIFKDHFFEYDNNGNHIKDTPHNARQFYSKVRCGLMHEARTKGEWLINVTKNDNLTQRKFILQDGNFLKIYRTVLHFRLKEYFERYLMELRTDNNSGEKLRRLFARKLDHLFDIPRDEKNFDWWKDK